MLKLKKGNARQVNEAIDEVTTLIIDGLKHGFFDYRLTCEIVNGRKRRFVIWAGKTHQFTIAEDTLQN